MKIDNFVWNDLKEKPSKTNRVLVLCAFGRSGDQQPTHAALKEKYPNGEIILFSTSGHFISSVIHDDQPIVSVIEFNKSTFEVRSYSNENYGECLAMGTAIGADVGKTAKGVCIISDGGVVNGTQLIEGINSQIIADIPIFGGMAGDGTRFQKTLVGVNAEPESGRVGAISFYGDALQIKSNCDSGWISLGLEFKITSSVANKLIELNDKNAYDVLYDFLAPENQEDFAKTTLYYPFSLVEDGVANVIRTPILVDHVNKTLTYAGDMPEGATVKLMKSGTMQLLDSTVDVAKYCATEDQKPSFIFATSCVGRRVVLDDMANEEYTELQSVFGSESSYFGFYSYGEFSRSGIEENCKLHNQTLALAVLTEN
ncbi:MAG: hypothetical protein GQ574_20930 [Crocinitomix sp.]|nr:hypothetical protein [Crocinitomix sp.]